MRFKVIDTKNGKKYAVEEVELSSRKKIKTLDEDCCCQEEALEPEMVEDAKAAKEENLEGGLSEKEIKALKKLAKYADDIVAVFEEEDKEDKKEDKKGDKEEPIEEPKGKAADDEFGEDEDLGLEDEEEKEEVVDLDEEDDTTKDSKPSITDSKKSFGSIEKKESKQINDSEEDEIAEAWKAYYAKAKER